MKLIEKQYFPNERDLYGADGLLLRDCTFDGVEDGESALKESKDIALENCYMNLRYPLWHDEKLSLDNVTMTENCRAALWYSKDIFIKNSNMLGIKALRECADAAIANTKIVSPEFGWKSNGVTLNNCALTSEYAFLLARDLSFHKVDFKGKYSFQYVENAAFEDCTLDTKDAFWHTKNVTVRNCVVKGEYLGWYSENLTFENCTIIGTQPLCYCKGLRLIDCKTELCDLAFEYSQVQADIRGDIVSVKNPLAGVISADTIGEIIYTKDSKHPCACRVEIRKTA